MISLLKTMAINWSNLLDLMRSHLARGYGDSPVSLDPWRLWLTAMSGVTQSDGHEMVKLVVETVGEPSKIPGRAGGDNYTSC